mgnify:CR=1 FL=1
MITRMQALAAAASGKPVATDNQAGNGVDFSAVLKNAIENVNTAQNSARAKAQSFSTGASDTSLEDVVENCKIGDTVRVQIRIKEGEKERLQIFEGLVIAMKGTLGQMHFTVRKISNGVAIERVFPLGEFRQAFELLESRHLRGKIILVP